MTNTIGDNIRKRRTQLNLSQKKIADYLGITQQAYSKYEKNLNSFNFETALKLGEILEISLDELGLDYRSNKPLPKNSQSTNDDDCTSKKSAPQLSETDAKGLEVFRKLSDKDKEMFLQLMADRLNSRQE